MSLLLKEIRKISADAARALEGADLRTDAEIRCLTREDLRELFPETKLKLRIRIFQLIQAQWQNNLVPDESFRAAVTGNGVLVEYLKILKDTKAQLNHVQAFLDAHIDLLENIGTNPHDVHPHTASRASQTESWPQSSISPTRDVANSYTAQNTEAPQGFSSWAPAPLQYLYPQRTLVKCRTVVSGTTFDTHLQLMEKVKSNCNLDLVCLSEENSLDQDYQVTIVFCPIASRIGTDVEAAMSKVTGDKPVILVLMEHKPEASFVSPMRVWDDYSKVVLHVYVFFHEKKHGLLQCHQNDEAASRIQSKLLEYGVKISQHATENVQDRTRRTINSSKDSNAESSKGFGYYFKIFK